MSLHKYFTIEKRQSFPNPMKVSLLKDEELQSTNHCVERSVNPRVDPLIHNRHAVLITMAIQQSREQQLAVMRQKMEQHKPASVHFSKLLRKRILETIARSEGLKMIPVNNVVNFVYFHCRMTRFSIKRLCYLFKHLIIPPTLN